MIPLFFAKSQKEATHQPFITVIVAAHNELENLKNLLPSLINQQYPNFEIIISLDRCSDYSKDFLESLSCEKLIILDVKEIPNNWNGKKYVLQKAIDLAKSDWLLFTDADCTPASSQWISSFARQANDESELIIGLSPYRSEKTTISQIVNFETLQTAVQYTSAALRNKTYMGVGRNLAYRKSAFNRVGGFDKIQAITGGDDDLLVQKMANPKNTAINLEVEGLTYSVPKRTWNGYFNQKTRHLSVGKFYTVSVKKDHMIRTALHAALWLSFLYLLIFYPLPARILGIFGMMIVVKALFFRKISKKLNFPLHLASYPIMDLVYAIFLPLVGMRAQVVKSIRWKK